MATLFKKYFSFSHLSLYIYVFCILIVTKIIGTYFLPLMHPSETRYAEIARKMVETRDWITLLHDYNTPFWAKPPLSTWISAIGMALFGTSPFAARFPVFLTSIGIIWLIMNLAKTRREEDLPITSALILLSSGMFYLLSSAVMTDIPLTLGTTLCMVSFWRTVKDEGPPIWKYLFFVGLAIGFLAKGLVAVALTGVPTAIWGLTQMRFKDLWRKFPWILGAILMFAISAPWYILAEYKTPGFLHYFFIGEHLERFLVKRWAGDRYGIAHAKPRGYIWPYWFSAALPWSAWFLGVIISHVRQWRTLFTSEDGWILYLYLWISWPLLFFTFSQNIIATYCLPSIPAFALLIAYYSTKYIRKFILVRIAFFASVFIVPIYLLTAMIVPSIAPDLQNPQKDLVEALKMKNPIGKVKILYWGVKDFSIAFYSNGASVVVLTKPEIIKALEEEEELYVIMSERQFSVLPKTTQDKLEVVDNFKRKVLYRKPKHYNPRLSSFGSIALRDSSEVSYKNMLLRLTTQAPTRILEIQELYQLDNS